MHNTLISQTSFLGFSWYKSVPILSEGEKSLSEGEKDTLL